MVPLDNNNKTNILVEFLSDDIDVPGVSFIIILI